MGMDQAGPRGSESGQGRHGLLAPAVLAAPESPHGSPEVLLGQ